MLLLTQINEFLHHNQAGYRTQLYKQRIKSSLLPDEFLLNGDEI
jgi:hypothetical protein